MVDSENGAFAVEWLLALSSEEDLFFTRDPVRRTLCGSWKLTFVGDPDGSVRPSGL